MSAPVGTCAFGHLIYIGQRCHKCEFEIMVARILNEGFEDYMNQNPNLTDIPYYCSKCTARKFAGWIYCPLCGIQSHYYVDPSSGEKFTGSGVVRLHQATVESNTQAAEQSPQGQYEKIEKTISAEEHQFNTALDTVRETFEKLKRSRKLREKAEKELKEAVGKIHEQDSRIHLLQQEIGRIQRPEPFAIRNVYGQVGDRHTQEVLGILKIEQNYPVCDITVRLPR